MIRPVVMYSRLWMSAACCFLAMIQLVAAATSPDRVWTADAKSHVSKGRRPSGLSAHHSVRISRTAMESLVGRVPQERSARAQTHPAVMYLPMPDGEYVKFQVEESPIMHPGLAAKFPGFKTFLAWRVDDPGVTARLDWLPQGFHAQIRTREGMVYIDPAGARDPDEHICYARKDARRDVKGFHCLVEESFNSSRTSGRGALASRSGDNLRTYRLAVAATGEYTAFHGGTVGLGLAAIVTAINRVVGIYETELAIRFELVADNNLLVYTNSGTDPYSNNDGSTLLAENQANIDLVIGSASYDVGHVFSTGGGGVATLGGVCNASLKARGVTGQPSPVGDPFFVDFVAHEIGHQFNATHTFNGDSGSCGGNRSAGTAYEPGSGSTIMAYAGICGNDDIQQNSDPYFHAASHDQIESFVSGGGGATCAATTSTGNAVPTISAGSDYTIPAATPFELTATGSDDDVGDVLTFNWEELDLGPQRDVNAADNGASPLFRSWPATTNPVRTFPRLSDLLNNTTVIGEQLPTTLRTMTFRAMVRDNRAGGGGYDDDDMTVTVVDSGAPFLVTFPDTSLTLSGPQTVTWDVAGTTAAPISTPTVNILLSTDGGQTFPSILASSVPNTGTSVVTLPNIDTTTARIKVQGANTIFFDISNANFTIEPSTGLSVFPLLLQVATGLEGGPFAPSMISYQLENNHGESLSWSAGADVPWLTVSAEMGVIATGESNQVDVTVGPAAEDLLPGAYTGTLAFTNLTLGGTQFRQIQLDVLPQGGTLSFSPVAYNVVEDALLATVMVQRAGGAVGVVSATVETMGGTAEAGSDYTSTTGIVSWADGDSLPKGLAIPVIDDSAVEDEESFTVLLRSPTAGALVGAASNATVSIVDNDSNDLCTDAIAILSTPFSFSQGTDAASSSGDPPASCIGSFGNGVWYSFLAPSNAVLTVTTEGSTYDTGLAIYLGSCGSLTEVGCDDDSGTELMSRLSLPVVSNTTYFVLAGGYNGAVGSLTVNATVLPTGGLDPGCTNAFLDSGFEEGDPWTNWTLQASTSYGTPLCSTDSCGTGSTYLPYTGANWVDFFGPNEENPETMLLGQTVLFPAGASMELQFQMWVSEVSDPFTDVLSIKVDDTVVDTYPEPFIAESGYTLRTVNLDAFADGDPHTVSFEFISPANGGFAGFEVDDVVLQTCLPDFDMDGDPDATDPDDDNDGIPDTWEVENGLNPLFAADALIDGDGDSVTNFFEWIADTSPTNGDSVLRVTIAPGAIQGVIPIQFDGSTARVYFVDQLTDLSSNTWSNVWTNEPGSGEGQVLPVTNQAGALFLRLGVEIP